LSLKKIRTIDLPLGSLGYRRRKAQLKSLIPATALPKEKFALFAALVPANAGFVLDSYGPIAAETPSPRAPQSSAHARARPESCMARPQSRSCAGGYGSRSVSAISPPSSSVPTSKCTSKPSTFPERYRSLQIVKVAASLAPDGQLSAKVHYSLRGDNELLLRVTFHKAAQRKNGRTSPSFSLFPMDSAAR